MDFSNRLAVIILNFRTPEITINCVKTLVPEVVANPGMRIILVDNHSGDDSIEKISSAILENGWSDSWLEFRLLNTNLGFAGGNNLILREQMALSTPPKYILLLNSDTLVSPGCIATCLSIMEKDRKIGALSCMLRNSDGSVQNVCRKFPRPFREAIRALGLPWFLPSIFGWADLEDSGWDREKVARDVDWIGGAFFFTRTEALEKAGILDEDFFFYGEDIEWCFRIWKYGWRVHFDPSAEIIHLGGASSEEAHISSRSRDIYAWDAKFKVQEKCYGKAASLLSYVLYLLSLGGRKFWMQATGGTKKASYNWINEGFDQLLSLPSAKEFKFRKKP